MLFHRRYTASPRCVDRFHRKSLHVEPLEPRTLLAVTTPVLGAGGDVVFLGGADADSVVFSLTAAELLQHNRGGRDGFHSNVDLDSSTPGDQTRTVSSITSLTFTDAGGNDIVTFAGSNAFAFNHPGFTALSVAAGTIIIDAGIATTGVGAVNLAAERNIEMNSASSITTAAGEITLKANPAGTATGTFAGISVERAEISSSSGKISLAGHGGDAGGGNSGVRIREGAMRSSTGAITMVGTGGGDGSGDFNQGVLILGGSVTSSGTDKADAAAIAIHGTGGNGTSRDEGVEISGIVPRIGSVAGDISIAGITGTSSVSSFGGVFLARGVVESTGTTKAGAAAITIHGVGGSRGAGVAIQNTVRSVAGDIDITGNSGDSGTTGVSLSLGGTVESTGTDKSQAAEISIQGSGGNGGSNDSGVAIAGDGTYVSSVAGDIEIAGNAGGTAGASNNSHGVAIFAGAAVTSSGTVKSRAATILIDGQGAEGTSANRGVYLYSSGSSPPTRVTSVAGDIRVLGRGGSGTGSSNMGVALGYGAVIESSGTDEANAAAVAVDGIGGSGTRENHGLQMDRARVASVAGEIRIQGTAGAGSSGQSHGVYLNGFAAIESTGTAGVHLTGTGGATGTGNDGVRLWLASVNSAGDRVHLQGSGGGRLGNGIVLTANSSITAAAADSGISLDGSGSPAGGRGALITDSSTVQTPAGGEIDIVGTGYGGQAGIEATGLDAGAGTVTLTAPAGVIREAEAGIDATGSIATINGDLAPAGIGFTGAVIVDGNASLDAGDVFRIDVKQTAAGIDYDQLQILGPGRTVELAGSKLGITRAFTPSTSDSFTIIDNVDSTSTVAGTFFGLPEGAAIPGTGLSITYRGGTDHNDVVLYANAPPQAMDDRAATDEDRPVAIDVLANDGDPDQDALAVTGLIQRPGNGTAEIHGDGTMTYVPNADFHGTDSFVYEISDGHGGSDTATVTITVNSVIDAVIDIKPGSDANPINLRSNGVLPVALLTTRIADGEVDDFDATSLLPKLDAGTIDILFGEPESELTVLIPWHFSLEDVDGDGDLDLLMHFRMEDIRKILGPDDARLTLNIEFTDDDADQALGVDLSGSDWVRVVPPKGEGGG